jgi:hypothetical protein
MRSREVQARRNSDVLGKERTHAKTLGRGRVALAQRNRGSVSEDAPLKNRLNKTIFARRSGIENRRNLLRLNFRYGNDVWKEWLKRSEPYRLRNRLRRSQGRRLQVLAAWQITASISFLMLRGMMFLCMHRALRTYIRL